MKTAGMILGVLGGLLGIFGAICTGAVGAGISGAAQSLGDSKTATDAVSTTADMMGVAIGAAILAIIISIVLKVAKSKKIGITSGVLIVLCGLVSFIAANYTSSVFFVLAGILGTVGALQEGSKEA